MKSSLLAFPVPRIPLLRRTGILRPLAVITLLLFSAAILAAMLGSTLVPVPRPAPGGPPSDLPSGR